MKRLIALLLALCLPVSALAETVAERVGAPETWQGEFATNTGKSRVYVDMTVQVPDADAFPIYVVEPRVFSIEEIVHLADIMLGEGNWHPVSAWDNEPVGDEASYIREEYGTGEGYVCSLQQNDNELNGVSGQYAIEGVIPDWYSVNSMGFGQGGEHFGRNVGAVDDAIALANEVVSQIAPDMVLDSVDPKLEGLGGRTGRGGKWDYGYRIYYARNAGGIPVTPVYQQGARELTIPEPTNFSPILKYEKLSVDVGESGIFGLSWSEPIEITEMVAEDCELLTFEQIMDILAAIAPLSIQHMESEGNNALYINRAVLGYMCVQECGKPTSYRLIPVWDFYGVRTFARERYDTYNWSWLTINAIDGTIIDRDLGY